jgi:hypothetical protein
MAVRTEKDARLPIHLRSNGEWGCNACQRHGDIRTLIALSLGLPDTRGRNWWRVKEWIETGENRAIEFTPEPITRIDPLPALTRSVPFAKSQDPRLHAWLAKRNISPAAPGGWLPRFSAPWWPGHTETHAAWSERYPVVVPCCDARGSIVSMQGISPDDSSKRWPRGASSKAVLFADRGMRAWLAGRAPPPKVLVIVEGVIDYLTVSPLKPTLGIAAGFDEALAAVTLPDDTSVYFGTHLDGTAGYLYQDKVADALNHPVRRLPFELAA